MSEEQQRFSVLMRRLRAGSEDAARELLDVYGAHVCRAVRRRLHIRLRSRYDSQDFAQAVWASFFAHLPEIQSFTHPKALVAFLVRVASNKVIDEYRRHFETEKHDIRRECFVEYFDGADGDATASARSQPTPSAIVSAREQFERLVEGQPNHYREIVERRAAGESNQEIAERMDINERTVRRVLQMLERRAAKKYPRRR